MAVHEDALNQTDRVLETLPWAESAKAALTRYLEEQPSQAELKLVDACQVDPAEMLLKPHFKVRAIENELAHMFRTFLVALEQTLDEASARKVAYEAGLAHGKRRLGTFLRGRALHGGVEAMAMWQDTAHASAGSRHTSALFARHDHEVVEVVRTEDSFGSVGQQSPVSVAFFAGFIDGYKFVDPGLTSVEELRRERGDGKTEFVVRFWYVPEHEPQ